MTLVLPGGHAPANRAFETAYAHGNDQTSKQPRPQASFSHVKFWDPMKIGSRVPIFPGIWGPLWDHSIIGEHKQLTLPALH